MTEISGQFQISRQSQDNFAISGLLGPLSLRHSSSIFHSDTLVPCSWTALGSRFFPVAAAEVDWNKHQWTRGGVTRPKSFAWACGHSIDPQPPDWTETERALTRERQTERAMTRERQTERAMTRERQTERAMTRQSLQAWNQLPADICHITTPSTCKQNIKKNSFHVAYGHQNPKCKKNNFSNQVPRELFLDMLTHNITRKAYILRKS